MRKKHASLNRPVRHKDIGIKFGRRLPNRMLKAFFDLIRFIDKHAIQQEINL